MKKKLAAILAAVLMTACMGASILAIGAAAAMNTAGTAPANSRAQMAAPAPAVSQQAQVQQLQDLISQYKGREVQYQAREQQFQQQLGQSNSQVQQAQMQMQAIQQLLLALQQRGLITVTADGQIFINR
jgi:hypothetical protein